MLDSQLSKVYVNEALKEAAQARADRKTQTRSNAQNNLRLLFLMVAMPIVFWLFR